MTFSEFKDRYQKKGVETYPSRVGEAPMVTVCLQTYNHEPYIEQCLESILAQKTTFSFEILIGEDDSGDSTREICKRYADQYPEIIRLQLHEKENKISINNTLTGRFNFLYKLFSASGKYIALIDGDDLWNDTTKLQQQVEFLEANSDYGLSFHNTSTINQQGDILQKDLLNYKETTFYPRQLITALHIPTSTVVFRNEIHELPDSFTKIINADSLLFAHLGKHKNAYYHTSINNNFYRYHDGGMWSKTQYWQKRLNSVTTLKALKENHEKKYSADLNRKLAASHWSIVKTIPGIIRKLKHLGAVGKYVIFYIGNRYLNIDA